MILYTSPSRLDYLLLVVGSLATIASGIPFLLLGVLFGQLVDNFSSTSCSASLQTDK